MPQSGLPAPAFSNAPGSRQILVALPGLLPDIKITSQALLALLLIFSLTAAQEFSPMPAPAAARELNVGICVAEAGGAIVGLAWCGLLGWYGGMLLSSTWTDGTGNNTVAGLVAASAGIAGCAGGTYLMGNGFRQGGQFLPTLAWTTGSVALGTGLLYAKTRAKTDIGWLGTSMLVATPFVATLGYNLSRPRDAYGGRFLPGSVAVGSVKDADGVAHPSLDVRLATVRF
jgi:hypothetical protein